MDDIEKGNPQLERNPQLMRDDLAVQALASGHFIYSKRELKMIIMMEVEMAVMLDRKMTKKAHAKMCKDLCTYALMHGLAWIALPLIMFGPAAVARGVVSLMYLMVGGNVANCTGLQILPAVVACLGTVITAVAGASLVWIRYRLYL